MTILDGDIDAFARGPAVVDRHRARVPVMVVYAAGSGPLGVRTFSPLASHVLLPPDGEPVAVVGAAGSGPPAGPDDGEPVAVAEKRLPR